MNRLSMDLSEMTLTPCCFDEETWLIEPSDMSADFSQTISETNEDEDLKKWLEGAVKKVDFRTRSALSRRLEKKKLRREKKERSGLLENSLAMIDEGMIECGKDKYITERWLSSSPSSSTSGNQTQRTDLRFEGTDSEEEFFYDASSNDSPEAYYTPRKNVQSFKPNELDNDGALRIPGKTSSQNCLGGFSKQTLRSSESKHMNLSELERKAKEQEQELRMELINRRERLFTPNGSDFTPQHSRPISASSSASSSMMNLMATSKSVDFRATQNGNTMHFRSNNESMLDINRSENKNLTSRLPMPRRLTVPGKTSIPLPTLNSAKTLNRQKKMSIFKDEGQTISLDVDDDCF